jgi:asparagine synthase (glutamine-hydrolysing)
VKVDRASMACHLEARVPFLDHRVVETGVSLPEEYTLARGGKRVTKELFARAFGRTLADRPKMGFGVPVEQWMRGPLSSRCQELFSLQQLRKHSVLSDELAHQWRSWLARDPQVLWHGFALAEWLSCANP